MAVTLGGRVAEEIVISEDEVTTGAASNDLLQIECSCLGIVSEEQEAV